MKKLNIQSLVVGVDFSDYSKIVAREAMELANELKVPLTFVYVYEDVGDFEGDLLLDRRIMDKFYHDKIEVEYGVELDQKVQVCFGCPEVEIIKVAEKQRDPLIVVGHRSGKAISRFFLGSIAEKLALMSPYPLWIHRGEKVLVPHQILIPSDLSDKTDKAIEGAEFFQRALKSEFEIYHVLQEPIQYLDYESWLRVETAVREVDDELVEKFKHNHPDVKFIRSTGSIAESIVNRAQKFDIVAVSARKQSKEHYGLGRVGGKLMRSGEKPVLVVP